MQVGCQTTATKWCRLRAWCHSLWLCAGQPTAAPPAAVGCMATSVCQCLRLDDAPVQSVLHGCQQGCTHKPSHDSPSNWPASCQYLAAAASSVLVLKTGTTASTESTPYTLHISSATSACRQASGWMGRGQAASVTRHMACERHRHGCVCSRSRGWGLHASHLEPQTLPRHLCTC